MPASVAICKHFSKTIRKIQNESAITEQTYVQVDQNDV